jgi:membrane protease YdiL (CAAX protease family)
MNAPLPPPPDELLLEAPPMATWAWWEAAAVTLLGFVIGSVAAAPVIVALGGQSGGRLGGPGAAGMVVVYLVLVATLLVWLHMAHRGWLRSIGWPARGERLREAAAGLRWGLASQLGVYVVVFIVASALAAIFGRDVEPPRQVDESVTGWAVVAIVVYAVIMAPVAEELVFRGLLFHAIADHRGFWAGAIASAVPFGIIHIVSGSALDVSVLVFAMMVNGLLWAWIHWRHRNLLVSIATHAAFNMAGVLVALELWRS